MYVKTTDNIWGSVEGNIDSMFNDRIRQASDWLNYGLTAEEIKPLIINKLMSQEEQATIERLGPRFFPHKHDNIKCIICFNHEDDMLQAELAINLVPSVRYPAHWNGYSRSEWPVISDGPISDIAKRRHESILRIKQAKKEFLDPLKEAYYSAPSVNALLKIWPAFADLLPPDVIERVNRKTERKKQDSLEVDASALSVHLLKAKVAK